MKTKRFTLFLSAFLYAFTLLAQDPALGEDDFYITPSYLINHPNFSMHNEGRLSTVPSNWHRNVTVDGDYIKVQMGINALGVDNANGSKDFVWRSGFQLRNDAAGQGVFKISKDYPVMAVKLGMPKANEVLSNSNNNLFTEYTWWNPVTGTREKVAVNGIPGNGKVDHVKYFPYTKNHLGGDSIMIYSRTNDAFEPPVIWGGVQVDDPVAEVVYFMDFSSAFQNEALVENNIKSFQMAIFGFSCFAVADTLKRTGIASTDEETGNVTAWSYDLNTAKTLDEVPTYRIKWIRGFASQEAFHEFVAQNNGDGPTDDRSDAQKALFEALRKAKKLHTAYNESNYDVVTDFSDKIDEYNDYYENTPAPNDNPESPEWIAWDTEVAAKAVELADLNKQFVADLAFTPTEYLYKIQSASDGRWLALGEDLTVNDVNGKQLIFVQNQSDATKFYVTSTGASTDGIPLYTLKANGHYIGMIGSTILAVPEAKKGSATIILNFMNRDDSNELYGIGLGSVYANYAGVATGLVSAETFSYQDTYKFSLEPYVYEAGNDPKGFFEWTFDTTGDTEGWERNNYRPWIEIEQGTYDGQGCLVHKATATYEPNNTNGTQITSFPTGVGTRREAGSFAGGQYPNEYELSPISDSIKHRPEDYLIVANSGINRYFAIKAASSNPAVDVAGNSTTGNSTFTFYQAFGDGLVLNFPDAIEKRGDVFIFDLLAAGMPPGGVRYVNQYMGNMPLNDPDERVYIDWMRTYETLAEIPSESFSGTSISSVKTTDDFLAYGSQSALNIQNYSGSTLKVDVFSIDGRFVKTIWVTGSYATVPFNQGLYIVRAKSENGNHAQKVIVK